MKDGMTVPGGAWLGAWPAGDPVLTVTLIGISAEFCGTLDDLFAAAHGVNR